MNIIIPIGGVGQRFVDDGYLMPKPLISVLGKPMIYRVIDNLKLKEEDTIYIIYNTQLDAFNFENLIQFYFPKLNIKFIPLNHVTKGASETILYGLNEMPAKELDKEFLILDCDTFYEEDVLELYRKSFNKNLIFYFKDEQSNPIYSYIKLDDDGDIIKIEEKVKISDNANTGAYGFYNGDVLKQYIKKLNPSKGELYTSKVYAEMLKQGVVIRSQQVSNFNCVGTPLQLQVYCNNNKDKAEPLRVCFDLDNTLVSYPTIPGDYYSVTPIQRNIDFAKLLKSLGHTIIIHTARRMKTHSGNVGAVISDISRVTLDTLDKFNIPYDELYFGKPYANFYIDDLSVNPSISMNQAIGIYDTTTEPRSFNKIEYEENSVTKTTSNPGEIFWYKNIPRSLQYLFPKVWNIRENTITMEKIDGVTFSYLYTNKMLKVDQLKNLLSEIYSMHMGYRTEVGNETDYLHKLFDRYINNEELYGRYPNTHKIYNKLFSFFESYPKYPETSIIHGDPVFTNVFQTKTGIKLIDMKGKVGDELTLFGDMNYDYAKIYQSIIGYDFILNGIEMDNVYMKPFKDKFEFIFKHELPVIKIITASLLFTMLPLHEEDEVKFKKYFTLINNLLDGFRDN
jgi:capsule biosynthesis phosphatase